MNKWLRVKVVGDVMSVGHVQKGRDDLFDNESDGPNVPRGTIEALTTDDVIVRERPSRGVVSEFSAASRRRMMTYLAVCRSRYTTMVTLTVPSSIRVTCGLQVKQRLDEMARFMLAAMRVPDGERPSVFWVLEFQESGQVHFHMLITGWIGKNMLGQRWAELWTVAARSSATRSVQERGEELYGSMCAASTRIEALEGDAPIAYIAKYAGKSDQKTVPPEYTDVGRFWGVYGFKAQRRADFGFIPLYNSATGELSHNVTAFWFAFTRIMTENASSVVFYSWRMGTGVCVYRKRGESPDVFRTIGKALLSRCSE